MPSSSSSECSRAVFGAGLVAPIRRALADVRRAEPRQRVASEFRVRFAGGVDDDQHRPATQRFAVARRLRRARAAREEARQKPLNVCEHARTGDFVGGRADRRLGVCLQFDRLPRETGLHQGVAGGFGLSVGVE
ncbi:hypothetical protein ABIE53_004653 [Burkholderia sp. OAS925]